MLEQPADDLARTEGRCPVQGGSVVVARAVHCRPLGEGTGGGGEVTGLDGLVQRVLHGIVPRKGQRPHEEQQDNARAQARQWRPRAPHGGGSNACVEPHGSALAERRAQPQAWPKRQSLTTNRPLVLAGAAARRRRA